MDGLYYQPCPDCGGLENAKKPQTTFSAEALTKGLREIYDGMNVRDEIERYIFEETLRQFNKATAKGIVESGHAADLSDEFIRQLRTNNTVFSAFRTHRMQNDVAKQLLNEKGHLKSFDRWMRDIKGMTNHYTGNWLQSEYSTAVIRAQQAADWKHFEEEQDVFPNLRWMPTTSPNQDPLHRQYWESKLTLPVNHPFWDEHRPGDRWNCKCRLEPTDEPANDRVIKGFNPVPTQPGLDNNPGKDGQIFSDSHPYFTNAYPGAEKAVEKTILQRKILESVNQVETTHPVGNTIRLGILDTDIVKHIEEKGISLQSRELYVSDHRIAHALRDFKKKEGKAVTAEQLINALSNLNDLHVYWDNNLEALYFATTDNEIAYKYVFNVNRKIKINGKKKTVNEFVTAGKVKTYNLIGKSIEQIK